VTFQEFAAARLPAVLAFAAVLTGQRATAEDIAQEVLIRVYARWDTIGDLDRPEFYVRKMVLNEFLSWRRRSWRLIPTGEVAGLADRTSDLADQYAERAALLAEIGKLPRRQCSSPSRSARPCPHATERQSRALRSRHPSRHHRSR
jgi:DNA-directed RNA polymerase specialized sigma24 family protein